jgi:hypothetical protein
MTQTAPATTGTPLIPDEELKANQQASLAEIPHPSLPAGSNLYGSTKIFPDYQAGEGECYFTLVHGIAHESSVSFVAILQALRALRKGYESVLYFYGPAAMNAMATRGFRPPASPRSPASTTSTPRSSGSSARAARSTSVASGSPCTACARRTSSPGASRATRSTSRTR